MRPYGGSQNERIESENGRGQNERLDMENGRGQNRRVDIGRGQNGRLELDGGRGQNERLDLGNERGPHNRGRGGPRRPFMDARVPAPLQRRPNSHPSRPIAEARPSRPMGTSHPSRPMADSRPPRPIADARPITDEPIADENQRRNYSHPGGDWAEQSDYKDRGYKPQRGQFPIQANGQDDVMEGTDDYMDEYYGGGFYRPQPHPPRVENQSNPVGLNTGDPWQQDDYILGKMLAGPAPTEVPSMKQTDYPGPIGDYGQGLGLAVETTSTNTSSQTPVRSDPLPAVPPGMKFAPREEATPQEAQGSKTGTNREDTGSIRGPPVAREDQVDYPAAFVEAEQPRGDHPEIHLVAKSGLLL